MNSQAKAESVLTLFSPVQGELVRVFLANVTQEIPHSLLLDAVLWIIAKKQGDDFPVDALPAIEGLGQSAGDGPERVGVPADGDGHLEGVFEVLALEEANHGFGNRVLGQLGVAIFLVEHGIGQVFDFRIIGKDVFQDFLS